MNKNINELSDNELKAIAYDLIVSIEQAQNNLKFINSELQQRQSPTDKKEDEKVKTK